MLHAILDALLELLDKKLSEVVIIISRWVSTIFSYNKYKNSLL